MIDIELRQELSEFLGSGERVLWCARPKQGIRFQKMDLFLVPFTLVWTGGAMFWEAVAITKGAPVPFAVFGALFVCAGLYITVGRFVADARARSHTIYALTEERALVLSGKSKRTIRSADLRRTGSLTFQEGSGGGGTIVFGDATPHLWMQGTGWPGSGYGAPVRFELAADAGAVVKQVRELQRAAA